MFTPSSLRIYSFCYLVITCIYTISTTMAQRQRCPFSVRKGGLNKGKRKNPTETYENVEIKIFMNLHNLNVTIYMI